MELTLEGSNSAETSPPGAGGVRLHHGKICEVRACRMVDFFAFLHRLMRACCVFLEGCSMCWCTLLNSAWKALARGHSGIHLS